MARYTKPLERPQMILVTMLELSGGTTRSLKYEDIVVKAFERFPEEFALRGYAQYPDSSDIHKPLYGPLKRAGFVRSGNKTFALTPRGVEEAKKLGPGGSSHASADRMSRDMEAEVERMLASEAFRLYSGGNKERVLDTDFYAFLGCSVRTPRNDFLGRMQVSADAIEKARALGRPSADAAEELAGLWSYLRERFGELIKRREGGK